MLLNLRIVTERTAALGVDGHTCELQLILRSFAELKVPSSEPLRSCLTSEKFRLGSDTGVVMQTEGDTDTLSRRD